TFTLTFAGQTTAAIDVLTDTAATVQAKLEALSTIGAGNVLVTGSTGATGGTYLLVFTGALGKANVPQVGVGTNSLAGTTPTLAPATQEDGPGNEVQPVTAARPGLNRTFTLTFAGQTTAAIDVLADSAATVQSKLQALPTIGSGNILVTGST